MRIVCSLVISSVLAFQLPAPTSTQQVAQRPDVSLKQPLVFVLEDGTPIKLRLTRNLSSADATTRSDQLFQIGLEIC